MKQIIKKSLPFIYAFMLGLPTYTIFAQVGPFTGTADVNLGGMHSASPQTVINVPVNVDLTTVTGFDVNALPIAETLGQYRFVIRFDGMLLEPQLTAGQIPGGTSTAFTDPVIASEQIGELSRIIIHATQTTSITSGGVLNVASIPFLVKGEVGSVTNLSTTVLDLRTPISLVTTPETAVIGGEMLPSVVTPGQININTVNSILYDADGDGIPDTWELANGLSPSDPADADADADGDGFTALQEYLASTSSSDPLDTPVGFAGLSYVLFKDEFTDSQYDDRWTIVNETPLAIYNINEATDQLNITLQQPNNDCNHIKLASLANINITNAILQSTIDMRGQGVVKIGLQQMQTLTNRIEIHIDSNLQQVVLQSWEDSVLTEQIFALDVQAFMSPINIRLIKNNTNYELFINHVNAASLANISLLDNLVQSYFELESCQADSDAIDLSVGKIEILLDRDADGLPDAIEDANNNGLVDVSESDPLLADDSDLDGLMDGYDNCIAVINIDQRDTDGDGFGNLCDGDLNNDNRTNTIDLNIYKSAHRTVLGDIDYNQHADFNGDNRINTIDLNIYKGLHRGVPGPSGLIP